MMEEAPLVPQRPAKSATGGAAARVALGACTLAIAATVLVAGATSRSSNAPPTSSPAFVPATPDLAGVDGPNPDQPRPTAFMRINPTVKPTGYPVHIDYSTPMPTRYTSPYPTAYNTQPTPIPTAAPALATKVLSENPPRTVPATPDLARQAGVDGPNPDQPRPTAFMRINPTVKPTGYPVHIDYSTPMPTRYTSPYPTAYNTQPTPLPTAAPAVTASKQTKNPPTKNPMPTRPKSPVPTTAPAR